ncbi:uncharacterized protein LOC101861939 [Aplysia californica]|uniref:Uncharacterized protein LOC101861939 n=1 Tax=Aplysia californica TaxID=6500 RepID=A0ABM0JF05_APLCA|nr:uncharacterized protein LOC101861939 [Aplysia californica]
MASIRRTDIMHKRLSKGRPAKNERDRIIKRQEAYKWRDARRVYLADSFDRWRKLRSTLKLKDSSLAWHLMEAHEKGQCASCAKSLASNASSHTDIRMKFPEKSFLPALIASIRQLCHTHFSFDECIEIVGLLCLEVDKKKKENFSVNELVKTGIKPALPSYISKSHYGDASSNVGVDSSKTSSMGLSTVPLLTQEETDSPNCCSEKIKATEFNMGSSHVSIESREDCHNDQPQESLTDCTGDLNASEMEYESVQDLSSLSADLDTKDSISAAQLETETFDKKDVICNGLSSETSTPKNEGREGCFAGSHHNLASNTSVQNNAVDSFINTSTNSESDPSFEIDVENTDTSQEIRDTDDKNNSDSLNHNKVVCSSLVSHSLSSRVGDLSANDECIVTKSPEDTLPDKAFHHSSHNFTVGNVELSTNRKNLDATQTEHFQCYANDLKTHEVEEKHPVQEESQSKEGPLDMSVWRPDIKHEVGMDLKHEVGMDLKHEVGMDLTSDRMRVTSTSVCSTSSEKSSRGNFDFNLPSSKRKLNEAFCSPHPVQSKSTKLKEEHHVSIPWQRRDMSRKEEYEFLEFNPFCDLAEFSQRYPHVHQRTYYRWKRRIKEEYIILEQCPEMSFQEFSSVVLQAKESVFHLWKRMISQGKGFYAPSDSSKRLEAKNVLPAKSSEYSAIQKNLSMSYELFSQQFPGVSVEVFNSHKQNAMQEFWMFYQNQHMSYKDFSKIVSVTEDVFKSWKEYVEALRLSSLSQNMKSNSNPSSPNSQTTTTAFQSTSKSSSVSSNVQYETSKGLFGLLGGNSGSKDPLSTTAHSLNPSLADTVARSLSASYLASLQNMMFPWQSYYGLTSPLNQQMLPMMLWPSMMGLTGGIGSHLGLLPGPQPSKLPKTSPIPGVTAGPVGSLVNPAESDKANIATDFLPSQTHEEQQAGVSKDMLDQTRCNVSFASISERRPDLSHDRDDVDGSHSWSRSRKQNKQEYIYYLKNPELCFKELQGLFPLISLRTFYRWRKEINAAFLLLEDNKDMTFHQFQLVFPDIPESIFESWKDKAAKGMPMNFTRDSQTDITLGNHELAGTSSENVISSEKYGGFSTSQLDAERDLTEDSNPKPPSPKLFESTYSDEGAHIRKYNKEEYIYVQRNPTIDFASFSKLFPAISVRSFYRWKKELKDAIDYLKENPDIDFEEYRKIDYTISEDVFNTWKSHVHEDDFRNTSENALSPSVKENRKLNGPEYWFLQMNPYTEFSQFARTYPEVPKRTFYRWKREIQQIMSYVRSQPNVQFSEISSVLPEVTQDAFAKWKEIIEHETKVSISSNSLKEEESADSVPKIEVDEQTKSEMTKALLHLMHHPTICYREFKESFPFVSANTFELWLNRIRAVVVNIASSPGVDFETFSESIKDVGEDIFNIWKGLSKEDIAAMDFSPEDFDRHQDSESEDRSTDVPNLKANLSFSEAFKFCQKYPDIHYSGFSQTYPDVSEEVFSDWMEKITQAKQFTLRRRQLSFSEFSSIFPHITEEVFKSWKECSNPKPDNQTHPSQQTSSLSCIVQEELKPFKNQDDEERIDCYNTSRGEIVFPGTEQALEKLKSLHPLDSREESSLSRLAKFADYSVRKYSEAKEISAPSLNMTERDTQCKVNNNNVDRLDTLSSMENILNVPATSSSYETLPGSTGRLTHGLLSASVDDITGSESNSLSALIAMSKDRPPRTTDQQMPVKRDNVRNAATPPSGPGHWTLSKSSALKDEDEAYSSQRQKKMSRAEYMYVKDNPDVDSQEFSRIFPGVSARTFYRWKKEIRAQLQLA